MTGWTLSWPFGSPASHRIGAAPLGTLEILTTRSGCRFEMTRSSRRKELVFQPSACSRSSSSWRKFHSVVGPAVADCEHPADWMIPIHVHSHRVSVPQFVADVEIYAFTHNELPIAVHVDDFPGLALHRPRGIDKSRYRDLC